MGEGDFIRPGAAVTLGSVGYSKLGKEQLLCQVKEEVQSWAKAGSPAEVLSISAGGSIRQEAKGGKWLAWFAAENVLASVAKRRSIKGKHS